jgi:hypothetical protein
VSQDSNLKSRNSETSYDGVSTLTLIVDSLSIQIALS